MYGNGLRSVKDADDLFQIGKNDDLAFNLARKPWPFHPPVPLGQIEEMAALPVFHFDDP
jgi:hypothetical protein